MNPASLRRVLAVMVACLTLPAVAITATPSPAHAVSLCRADADILRTSLGSIRAYHYATCLRNDVRVTVTGRLSQGKRTNVTKPNIHACRSGWKGPRSGDAWLCIHSDTTALGDRSGLQQYCAKTKITWSGRGGSGSDPGGGCASY